MTVTGNIDLFFKSAHANTDLLYGAGDSSFYAKAAEAPDLKSNSYSYVWRGNFFPDLRVWDQLGTQTYRGGGARVTLRFSTSATVTSAGMATRSLLVVSVVILGKIDLSSQL